MCFWDKSDNKHFNLIVGHFRSLNLHTKVSRSETLASVSPRPLTVPGKVSVAAGTLYSIHSIHCALMVYKRQRIQRMPFMATVIVTLQHSIVCTHSMYLDNWTDYVKLCIVNRFKVTSITCYCYFSTGLTFDPTKLFVKHSLTM